MAKRLIVPITFGKMVATTIGLLNCSVWEPNVAQSQANNAIPKPGYYTARGYWPVSGHLKCVYHN